MVGFEHTLLSGGLSRMAPRRPGKARLKQPGGNKSLEMVNGVPPINSNNKKRPGHWKLEALASLKIPTFIHQICFPEYSCRDQNVCLAEGVGEEDCEDYYLGREIHVYIFVHIATTLEIGSPFILNTK